VLRLWELTPSPNNIKVRMALRFKGIEFEQVLVDPIDRAPVLAVSGQELTPVIEDRGIVLNDSEAILQYLDANYPETPRLFPRERAGRYACDDCKRELDAAVAMNWLPVFMHGIKVVERLDHEARDRYEQALAGLDAAVEGKLHLRGPEMPICDLRVAEWAVYAMPGEGLLRRVPLFKRFRELFAVEPGRYPHLERFIEPWNERLA